MADELWYYAEGGQQRGPVDLDALRQLVSAGQLKAEDLVWRDGMASWVPLQSVAEFGAAPGVQPVQAVPAVPYAGMPAGGFPPPGMGYFNPTDAFGPNTNYAGFWLRVAAYVIDYLVLLIPTFAINFAVGFFIPMRTFATRGAPVTPAQLLSSMSGNFTASALGLMVGWLYYAFMEASPRQGTLGKMAVGLKVTDILGNPISFGKATGRFFGKLLSGLICGFGYFMAGYTAKKQGLHDQLAGTLVLRKSI